MAAATAPLPSVVTVAKHAGLQVHTAGQGKGGASFEISFSTSCVDLSTTFDPTSRALAFAENVGRKCALLRGDGVADFDAQAGKTSLLCTPQVPNEKQRGVTDAYFSPLGNFLVTYEHFVKNSGANNVNLWYLENLSGSPAVLIDGMTLQTLKPGSNWPAYKWTSGEEFCCRIFGGALSVSDLRGLKLQARFWAGRTRKGVPGFLSGEDVKEVFVAKRGKLQVGPLSMFELSNGPSNGGTASTTPDNCPLYISKHTGSSSAAHLMPKDEAELAKLSFLGKNADGDDDQVEEERFFASVFLPEAKGQPAKVVVYELGDFSDEAKNKKQPPQPVCFKAFYNASSVLMKWNFPQSYESKAPDAPTVLVFSGVDSSKTSSGSLDDESSSYYGSTTLFHLTTSEAAIAGGSAVTNLGEIQAAAWSPRKNEFLMLEGKTLPCALKLLCGKRPVLEKPLQAIVGEKTLRRNHVAWSSSGEEFVVAGLGNLAGDLDFYSRKTPKKQFERVRTVNFRCCTNLEWSRCGRFLLGSTLAPRMRVDCRWRLYSFASRLLHEQLAFDAEEISRAKKLGDESSGAGGKSDHMAKAYVPPHLRNVKIEGAADVSSAGGGGKKPKAKAKAGGAKDSGPSAAALLAAAKGPEVETFSAAGPASPAALMKEKIAEKVAAGAPGDLLAEVRQIPAGEERLKKAKALKKKLGQIERLKEKGPGGLSAEEKEKVATEPTLREAIAFLEQ
eukprot:g5665.t1